MSEYSFGYSEGYRDGFDKGEREGYTEGLRDNIGKYEWAINYQLGIFRLACSFMTFKGLLVPGAGHILARFDRDGVIHKYLSGFADILSE